MRQLPYGASSRERQIALAFLAHTARHDATAVTGSLNLLAELYAEVQPICVITALLEEFQQGMSLHDAEELAQWFSDQALALAADEARE